MITILLAFCVGVAIKAHASDLQGWPWGGSEDDTIGGRVCTYGVDATDPLCKDGNETGVGWISMSRLNCDPDKDGITEDNNPAGENTNYPSCPDGLPVTTDNNYNVVIPDFSGDLSGYAWSENIGWISFNASADLVNCPYGECKAKRVTTLTDHLEGWARIVGIKDEYLKVPSNSGGWEGWISLNDKTGNNYGVSIDGSGNLSGYGWSASSSGAAELGWIDFSQAKIVASNVLKICQNNCGTGTLMAISNASPMPVSMSVSDTKDLKACYNTSLLCDDASSDVTNDISDPPPNLVWAESGTTATSLSETDPKKLTADNNGSETITASYDGLDAIMEVTVSTSCSCMKCNAPQLCASTVFYDSNCPCSPDAICSGKPEGSSCAPPSGTNWKEVAP